MPIFQEAVVLQRSQPTSVSSTEAVDSHTAHNEPNASNAQLSDAFWVLLLASSVLIAVPCIFTLAEIRRGLQIWRLRQSVNSAIPCRTCHFFSNNIQLNCAVHPHTVLTKDAENCPDYCPSQKVQAFLNGDLKK